MEKTKSGAIVLTIDEMSERFVMENPGLMPTATAVTRWAAREGFKRVQSMSKGVKYVNYVKKP